MNFCPRCGTAIQNQGQPFCPNCGQPLQNQPPQGQTPPFQQNFGMQAQALPMKWFKFLIYFALFASAALSLFQGIGYVTGEIYNWFDKGSSDLVYGILGDGLKTLDVIFGIILIGIAVLAIYTRFRLANFKKNGPFLVCLLYLVNAGVSLLYNIALAATVDGLKLETSSLITSVFVSFAMAYVNYSYFKKREAMFVAN